MENNTKRNLKLLRPFDWSAAKGGEEICVFDGSQAFLVGPTKQGKVVLEFSDESVGTFLTSTIRMKPICWVEGKPVYKGDVLYRNDGLNRGIPHEVYGPHKYGGDGFTSFARGERTWAPSDVYTWNAPKQKREGWLNVYLNSRTRNIHPTKQKADELASIGRVACIHIEWEE